MINKMALVVALFLAAVGTGFAADTLRLNGTQALGESASTAAELALVSVQNSDWHGFQKESFTINGHAAYVVSPRIVAPGKPWVWRTSFPNYQPVVDLELLRNGWHIGYIEILDLLGSDAALDLVDQFYAQVRRQWGLAEKMAVEPCSRGGLPAYRYAVRHSERVACIYGDVPVMDFKSWPLQRPQKQKAIEWSKILQSYGFKDDAEAMAFQGNPIDQLAPIASAKIPIRHVICLNDRVVPPEQNTLEAKRRLQKMGWDMEVVSVEESNEDEGHHFPYPDVFCSVRFIMRHSYVLPEGKEYFQLRDGLANCRGTFQQTKRGRVAFLGGSITFNSGWRDETMHYLKQRFPETQFDFVAAGMPSAGSVPHAFRLERDVLSRGPVDLLFVEAAVNDTSNESDTNRMLRGMEGVIRHARAANPMTDIVQMHFVMPEHIADYKQGRVPASVAQHEKVAAHYGNPSVNLSQEVTARINAKEFTWAADFRDIHPSPYGQLVYANTITRMLDAAFAAPAITPRSHLPTPLDQFSYFAGRFGKLEDVRPVRGFALVSSWEPSDGRPTRSGFVNVPALVATEPGAEFQFAFNGRGVGLFITSGPDTGTMQFSVDGGVWKLTDTFTKWSSGLHLPWAIMLADELAPGHHTVRVRIADKHNPKSTGTALRVMHLLLN